MGSYHFLSRIYIRTCIFCDTTCCRKELTSARSRLWGIFWWYHLCNIWFDESCNSEKLATFGHYSWSLMGYNSRCSCVSFDLFYSHKNLSMNDLSTLILVVWLYMTAWFIVSVIQSRNDVADVAWGLWFVMISWLSYWLAQVHTWQWLLINIFVTVWWIRLAWHIFNRHRHKPEDARYGVWRSAWNKKWFYVRSYFQVFILQWVLLFLVSLPVLLINANQTIQSRGLFFLGVIIWLFGFFFEMIADSELQNFLKHPENRGKLMQTGLWKYSRHPNYFGEVVLWWWVGIVSLSTQEPWGLLWSLTITILILFVSWVPLLEKKYAWRPDFEAYKKKTSIFFPLLPKCKNLVD